MTDDPFDWDSRVEAWEQVAATPSFESLRDAVVEAARPSPEDRVLDLGAGTGLVTLALARRAQHVVALDISNLMLERLCEHEATEGIDNVEHVQGDMRSLPFGDETFDLVVSNYAFHHLEDPAKELALSEARRVLTAGGRLVVCDMMFSLSFNKRDRRLLARKLLAVARRGPAGLLRIARNTGRLATGNWEHPAPPETWERMLRDRHFDGVRVELLEQEAGLAVAWRPSPSRGRSGTQRVLTAEQHS